MPSREIALFGGSFNPPHIGHLLLATYVRAVVEPDELWIMPVGAHPFGKELAPFEDRVALCEEMARLVPRSSVTRVDGEPGLSGRTIHTVERLRERHPDTRFSLVLGTDTAADWDRWFEFDRLMTLVRPIVVGRQGYTLKSASLSGALMLTDVELPDVSSSGVRERLRKGEDASALVPAPVLRQIAVRKLYVG